MSPPSPPRNPNSDQRSIVGNDVMLQTYRNGAILPARNELEDPILGEVVSRQRGDAPSYAAAIE